jgi:hypothetical protein
MNNSLPKTIIFLSLICSVENIIGDETNLLKKSAAEQNEELIKFIDHKKDVAKEKVKECDERLNDIWKKTHRATSKEYIDTKVEKFNQQAIVDECERLKTKVRRGQMSYDLAILQIQSLGEKPQESLSGNRLQTQLDKDSAANNQYRETIIKDEPVIEYEPLTSKDSRDAISSGVKLPDVIIKIQEIAPLNREGQERAFKDKNPETAARYIKDLANRLMSENTEMVTRETLKQAVEILKKSLDDIKNRWAIKPVVLRTQIKPDESINALNAFAKKKGL